MQDFLNSQLNARNQLEVPLCKSSFSLSMVNSFKKLPRQANQSEFVFSTFAVLTVTRLQLPKIYWLFVVI